MNRITSDMLKKRIPLSEIAQTATDLKHLHKTDLGRFLCIYLQEERARIYELMHSQVSARQSDDAAVSAAYIDLMNQFISPDGMLFPDLANACEKAVKALQG